MLTDEQRHAVFVLFLLIVFLAVEEGMGKIARNCIAVVLAGAAIAWLFTRPR